MCHSQKEVCVAKPKTRKRKQILLIDNTIRDAPVVDIDVDTPYYTGRVEAIALDNAIYDLIIGNILGARGTEDPVEDVITPRAKETNDPQKKETMVHNNAMGECNGRPTR